MVVIVYLNRLGLLWGPTVGTALFVGHGLYNFVYNFDIAQFGIKLGIGLGVGALTYTFRKRIAADVKEEALSFIAYRFRMTKDEIKDDVAKFVQTIIAAPSYLQILHAPICKKSLCPHILTVC